MFNFIKDKLQDRKLERQVKEMEKDKIKEDKEKGRVSQVTCFNKKDLRKYTGMKAPLIYIQGELYSEIKKEIDDRASSASNYILLFVAAIGLGNLSKSALDGYEAEINISNRYILLKKK